MKSIAGDPQTLWNEIRGRKAEILAHANALDPGGRIVTLAALIRGAPGRDATKQGAAATPRECDQSGVPPELAARRSAEDLEDIKAGDITLGTVQAFEQAAIARETEGLKEFFEEHAGILYDAGLPRAEADAEAAKIAATFARNRSYSWASLRAALADYPVLLTQVPYRPRAVNAPGSTHGRRAEGQARAAAGDVHRSAGGEGMTAEAPAEKEEAPLSYEEAVQIAKDAGMSGADIARCQRLAALSEAEFEAAAERRMQQIGTSTNKPRGLAEEDPSAPRGPPGAPVSRRRVRERRAPGTARGATRGGSPIPAAPA